MRGNRGGPRRRAGARPPHRIARVRTLHRTADPEVCRRRPRRLRGDRSRPPRELVDGVPACRHARGDRPGRRLGDEPHGPRRESSGLRTPSARPHPASPPSCRRSPNPGPSSGRSRRTGSSATASPPRGSSRGPETTPAVSSAPGSCAKASSRSRSARATRSSASCPRRGRARTAPAMSSPRRPAPTWACRFSRTARSPANACVTPTAWTGRRSRRRSRARRLATAVPRCCPGSTPRSPRSSSNPASSGMGSNRQTPKPTSGRSSKRR